MNDDRPYRALDHLLPHKEAIERHLVKRRRRPSAVATALLDYLRHGRPALPAIDWTGPRAASAAQRRSGIACPPLSWRSGIHDGPKGAAGANVHDKRLVEPNLKGFAVHRPRPKKGTREHHFCGDKGYDYANARALLVRFGYTLHVESRGEEEQSTGPIRDRARRWVVERSHSWMNRFRRILIRWIGS